MIHSFLVFGPCIVHSRMPIPDNTGLSIDDTVETPADFKPHV